MESYETLWDYLYNFLNNGILHKEFYKNKKNSELKDWENFIKKYWNFLKEKWYNLELLNFDEMCKKSISYKEMYEQWENIKRGDVEKILILEKIK
jgi:hypothetical protein